MSETIDAPEITPEAPVSTSEPQELSLGEIIRQAAEGKTAEEITGAEPATRRKRTFHLDARRRWRNRGTSFT